MKVLICKDEEAAIARAADHIADHLDNRATTVLGLATGGTMLPLYRRLIGLHAEGLSFASVTTFNLDEYVGLSPEHPASYHAYMREALFDHVDIDPARAHLPRGDAPDPAAEAEEYEARIARAGGISLQLLGIGRNGHIGFNEPTSSLASPTRIKTLTESTRRANRPYFEADENLPQYAITMGVGTILSANECLLLATGGAKAGAVAAMIEGPVAAICPASALQLHPRATIVLDREAAAELKLKDYYNHVHPDGEEACLG
ncbi:MAG: glucosamine-6-phosphate deaminase [Paracoccus denitrificans]|uniref:Glucosamine-6-phosphate deaminase n=1 Tax=Paracoccus denitrificans TaxID=266 RepID=A0A533IBI8_PARDE|nr:MAG: glucosamine-6-phosphate deaminase [Paracoccus denitrificans]